MVSSKKSGMVNALIVANAILALVIGSIIWMLMSKNKQSTPEKTMSLTSAQSQTSSGVDAAATQKALQDQQAELAALRDQLAAEKQRVDAAKAELAASKSVVETEANKQLSAAQTDAIQARKVVEAQLAAERQKVVEINTQLQNTQTKAHKAAQQMAEENASLAEQIASEKEALAKQLQRERERVDQLASAQVKANLENRRLIEQLRAQIQAQQSQAQDTAANNRQQVISTQAAQPLLASLDTTIQQASDSDKDYIQALGGDVEPYIKSAEQQRALQQAGTDKVDYFNRVVVASNRNDQHTGAITSKVDELLAARASGTGSDNQNDDTYVASLDPLAQQRESESRYITVVEGDTLSNIAARAYGDWRDYMRIFEANPQIVVNPDLIYPGQVLRVPL